MLTLGCAFAVAVSQVLRKCNDAVNHHLNVKENPFLSAEANLMFNQTWKYFFFKDTLWDL